MTKIDIEAMRDEILIILAEVSLHEKDIETAQQELLDLFLVSKCYAWLRPDGTTSGLFDEEHKKNFLTSESIKIMESRGNKLLEFNVC